MHSDRYKNFDELAGSEDANAFRIEAEKRNSSICVLAPHGGKIEVGTSELARAVAGNRLSYYLFEGRKPKGNRDLHVTSANFNEPPAVAVVESSDVALAMHGCEGDDEVIYLGGRHEKLAASIAKALSNRGFSVGTHKNPALQGIDRSNICNRAKLGMGVQFEITRALRVRLTDKKGHLTGPSLKDFVDAINEGMSQ
ncbi:poly-gamma-glutamate hydrolase family protein [Agrobacterium tumefaciens]|uniref:poly-gamma-glutamate hydrolase family protein n=1 Tax=Agrobacterium tumefaciens TaxID=358 RepID=UPI002A186703|nr:poly-gamma-glutamate hydrolase family protein [Agrobacterium tumefaciens]MDX8327354.1 poly-gamma-glutamate hydrolase family protein [Agrobacterium tumefaciens]